LNEKKSKAMLMTRSKRKERGEVEVYLNNKLIQQLKTFKYFCMVTEKNLIFRELITQETENVGN